jgi:hypothetical protein
MFVVDLKEKVNETVQRVSFNEGLQLSRVFVLARVSK